MAAKTDLAVLVSDTLLLLVMSVGRGGTTGSLNSGQWYIHSSTRVLATQGQYKLYGTRQCTTTTTATTTTTTTQSDIIAGPFCYTYKHTHTLSIRRTIIVTKYKNLVYLRTFTGIFHVLKDPVHSCLHIFIAHRDRCSLTTIFTEA